MLNRNLEFLAVIVLVMQMTTTRTYEEIYNQTCSTEILETLKSNQNNISEFQSQSKRLSVSVDNFAQFIQTKNLNYLLKDVGAPIILDIILCACCLLTFVFFVITCFKCQKVKNPTRQKSKAFAFVSLFFLIAFIALFIAMFVYLGRMDKNKDLVSCGIASIPYNFIEGVNTPSFKFLGLSTLVNVLTNFKGEISGLKKLGSQDFEAIANQNLSSKASAAVLSLSAFSKTFTNSFTTNGAGVKARPLSVQALTQNINDEIYAEFQIYQNLCDKLANSANAGQILISGSSLDNVQEDLQSSIDEIKNMTLQVDDNFGRVVTDADYFNRFAPVVYWIALAIAVVLFITALFSIFYIFVMLRHNTDRLKRLIQAFYITAAFFVVLFGLVSIVAVIGTAGVGTICESVDGLLTAPDVEVELNRYNLNISSLARQAIVTCLPAQSSGDLTSVFTMGSEVYAQTSALLDGLTVYQNLKPNFANQTSFSRSINNTVALWRKYRDGILPDQPDILSTLDALNKLVICGDFYYALNIANCTDSVCESIISTQADDFRAPSCSADAEKAEFYFFTIKNYTFDEFSLMSDMISGLSSTIDSFSPASKILSLKSNLVNLEVSVNNIIGQVYNTTSFSKSFQQGFASNMNCTILRKELEALESTLCFSFNESFYYFSCLLCFAVMALLAFSWAIYFSLCCMPTMQIDSGTRKETPVSNLFVTEEERSRIQ